MSPTGGHSCVCAWPLESQSPLFGKSVESLRDRTLWRKWVLGGEFWGFTAQFCFLSTLLPDYRCHVTHWLPVPAFSCVTDCILVNCKPNWTFPPLSRFLLSVFATQRQSRTNPRHWQWEVRPLPWQIWPCDKSDKFGDLTEGEKRKSLEHWVKKNTSEQL